MKMKFLFLLLVHCFFYTPNLIAHKSSFKYVVEVNTREVIVALAGENANDILFKKILSISDSLKKASPSRYSAVFFKTANIYGEKTLQKIFINNQTKHLLADTANSFTIIKLVEKKIAETMDRAIEVMTARLEQGANGKGELERIRNSDAINVELHTEEPAQTIRYLIAYGKLTMLYVYDKEKLNNSFLKADQELAKTMAIEKANASDPTLSPLLGFQIQDKTYGFYYTRKDTALIGALLKKPEIKKLFPDYVSFFWHKGSSKDLEVELVPIELPHDFYKALPGTYITEANYEEASYGGYQILFTLGGEGEIMWRKMTKIASESNPRKRIAIILDGICMAAPMVMSEIPNGRSAISGSFSETEAKDLASILNAGQYYASMKIVEIK
jgi:SecD/SecF fusion protein